MDGESLRHCSQCVAESFGADIKRWRCDACGFELYRSAAAAVCAVIVRDDRLLAVRRGRDPSRGMLDLPGGFVDPGETAEHALEREIAEELGVRIVSSRYVGSAPNVYPYGGVTYRTTDLCFRCSIDRVQDLTPNDDIGAIVWVPVEAIDLSAFAFASIRSLLADFVID